MDAIVLLLLDPVGWNYGTIF